MNKLQKKKQRMRLLAAINSNPAWSSNEEALQKVQSLAEPLFISRPPLPQTKLDWQNFKRSDFLFLLSYGYGMREITKIYKISSSTLHFWENDQGFSGKKNKKS